MDGWLNIYKPRGISSARAVAIVKRILGHPKTGHTGTLDLEAEGVLPLAIGEATKLVKFLMDAKKSYIFNIKFGAQTDTGDASGKVIASTDVLPTQEECESICERFIGTVTQIPPKFSALKVGGERELRREAVGIFKASDAINIETICANSEEASYRLLKDKSLKIEAVLDDILVLNATDLQAKKIRYGQKCSFELKADIDSVWIRYNGMILAIGSISYNCFNSSRVFNIIQNKENSDVDYR